MTCLSSGTPTDFSNETSARSNSPARARSLSADGQSKLDCDHELSTSSCIVLLQGRLQLQSSATCWALPSMTCTASWSFAGKSMVKFLRCGIQHTAHWHKQQQCTTTVLNLQSRCIQLETPSALQETYPPAAGTDADAGRHLGISLNSRWVCLLLGTASALLPVRRP